VLISYIVPRHCSDWIDIPPRSSRLGWPSGRHSFGATRGHRAGASDSRRVSAPSPAPTRGAGARPTGSTSKTCLTTTTARICLPGILHSDIMDNQVFRIAVVHAIVAEWWAQDCIMDDARSVCRMGAPRDHLDLHPLQSGAVLHK
jgi:hypothetical protein